MKNQTQQLFDCIYQDTVIHFLMEKQGDVMVNATEMAKLFGKQTKHFNELESTKKLIESCLISRDSRLIGVNQKEDLIKSVKNLGTYMHRIIALEFASWLDVDFKIWLLCRIDEIKFGKIKPLQNAVEKELSATQNLELALHRVMMGESEEAKELAQAVFDLNDAKRAKSKASRNFNNQLKMSI